jgi:hypothetical protein
MPTNEIGAKMTGTTGLRRHAGASRRRLVVSLQ